MQSVADILTANGDVVGMQLDDVLGVSADGTTIVGAGHLPSGQSGSWIAHIPINAFALLDLQGADHSLGSLLWGGTVTNSGNSAATLTVGSDNSDTLFKGVIQDGTSATALTKTGTGTLTLTGANTYSGTTYVNAGTLNVEGSIAASSLTTVNANAALTGTGTVGNTTISSGGVFMPGNGTAGSAMTVGGNLAFQSGALYLVQINPTTASFADVIGTAALGGATVNAVYANGSYVSKQYTILTAGGGVSGTFNSLVNTNLPSGFSSSLSYDANNAYLNLALAFTPPPGSGLSGNQQSVGNAIIGFFNSTGSIPLVFGGLTPAGLTQISGETATGTQQTTFNAMTQFMGLMTDPFIDGRGAASAPSPGVSTYAGEDALAYAANGRKRTSGERDAYGLMSKAPLRNVYDPRWSVWAASFGGSQTTDGNVGVGSNNSSSRVFGIAAGADYIFSPRTIAGFALAGGGTGFNVASAGSGRSDLFQAGAFVRHNVGAAYVTGALAYGWQDVATDRTLTVAGVDRLHAQFNANAWSGRLEGGYRFVMPWMGVTPYAAGQFTTYHLPAYAEQVLSGTNTFALNYVAKDVTASRGELGIRTDKSFAMQNAILTLRGRAAWAHNFNTDRGITPVFQTLPGAAFVVNGAAQAGDTALVTGSAEMKWLNGFSLAATFEGEFSGVTASYAGKGVARYAW
jgi:autotransporter-associated beta strand protein